MKKPIIAVAVVVLLAGIVFAAWYFLIRKPGTSMEGVTCVVGFKQGKLNKDGICIVKEKIDVPIPIGTYPT